MVTKCFSHATCPYLDSWQYEMVGEHYVHVEWNRRYRRIIHISCKYGSISNREMNLLEEDDG